MTRWFYVIRFDSKDGREKDVVEWLRTKGRSRWEGTEGIRSVNIFMRSLGLGQGPVFQVWLEISDFAFLDKWRDNARLLLASDELFPLIEHLESAMIKEVI